MADTRSKAQREHDARMSDYRKRLAERCCTVPHSDALGCTEALTEWRKLAAAREGDWAPALVSTKPRLSL